MRLGSRLTLAFLAVALVPAGAVLALTWSTVEARFEDEFRERLQAVASGLSAEMDRVGQRMQAKVQALAETEEVERILVDMVRDNLDRRALIRTAGKWMRAWELDMLSVLDGQAAVLSCGHLPARYGGKDEELFRLASREPLKPKIRSVQVAGEGMIREHLAVVVGTSRKFNEAFIALVGGRLLDDAFVGQLETLSGAHVVLVNEKGERIASGAGSRPDANKQLPPLSSPDWRRIPLNASDPTGPKVEVAMWVSRDRLVAAQQHILFGAGAAAVGGVFFSWLLGLLLSRRITQPVHALVEGARHVATGDLEHRVPGDHSAEIGELVRTFNRMVADLSSSRRKLVRAERVAAWQEIARRIAHEIKNPLSPIQVSIESMRKAYSTGHQDFPEIFEESTRAILEEVAALKRIVTEFSDFARMPKPTPLAQSINPALENAVNLYRNQPGSVEVVFEPGEDLPDVLIDKEQIGRVLSNLLSNAVYATDGEGAVRVASFHQDDRVCVRVQDDGRGMAPDVLARVFTPYFTTRQDGTGLGLAIVQRIVEDHAGSIEIESSEGSGTVINLRLPIAGGEIPSLE